VGKRERVSGLRVIDCSTGRIVDGEDNLYVALSYVWGSTSDTPMQSTMLPKVLPSTIADAITVTKKLGYDYIWIDRYCINQKDKQEAAEQVGKMDLIY
jgi:hypothetical protein